MRSEDFGKLPLPWEQLERCIHGEPPECWRACPFDLDMRAFIARIQNKNMDAALRQYSAAVVFPNIVSRICSAPCMEQCVRNGTDSAVQLSLLEQACVQHAGRRRSMAYNLPPKNKRVAVVGADIGGLACAVRMGLQKYSVTVYVSGDDLAPELSGRLPEEIYITEIKEQLDAAKVELRYKADIRDRNGFTEDAVCIIGSAGDESMEPRVFIRTPCDDPVKAIAEGIRICADMEWYLKTGDRKDKQNGPKITRLVMNTREVTRTPAVIPADGCAYTPEEAAVEAARCLLCDCTACVDHCEMLNKYKLFPKRLREDVEATLLPDSPFQKKEAMRPINSCNLCRRCQSVCPENIDLSAYLLLSRRELAQLGSMPPAFHEFWLRDMEDANEFALLRKPKEGIAKVAFFPGCQLGASDPAYVTGTYDLLRRLCPETGLLLQCCGMPAMCAGNVEQYEAQQKTILTSWEEMGRPQMLMACPSCLNSMQAAFPDRTCVSLYEYLAERMPAPLQAYDEARLAVVFDPCAAREHKAMRQEVRALMRQAGLTLEELEDSAGNTGCCSYGGRMYAANQKLADNVAKRSAEASQLAYVTYCTNCRDIFSALGKPVVHALDVLLNHRAWNRVPPTISQRRQNRRLLYGQLQNEEEGAHMMKKESALRLLISQELAEQMHRDLILESDVAAVISFCEQSGKKLARGGRGSFLGHLRRGSVTYWIEYIPGEGNGDYTVLCAYSHRMQLEEE